MSTYEDIDFNVAACPCGKGHIVKHTRSWDNPWSGADVSYELVCPDCSKTWELSQNGETLSSAKESAEHRRAAKLAIEAQTAAWSYPQQFVPRYLAGRTFKTKKAEWEFLQSESLFSGDYRRYLRDRREKAFESLGHANGEVAQRLVAEFGSPVEYRRLKGEEEKTKAASLASRSRIVRRKVG